MVMHRIRDKILSSPFSCMIAPLKTFLPQQDYIEHRIVYLATSNLTIQSHMETITIEAHKWQFEFQGVKYLYWDAVQTRLPLQLHAQGSNYTFLHFAEGPQTVMAHHFLISSVVPAYETCSTLGGHQGL